MIFVWRFLGRSKQSAGWRQTKLTLLVCWLSLTWPSCFGGFEVPCLDHTRAHSCWDTTRQCHLVYLVARIPWNLETRGTTAQKHIATFCANLLIWMPTERWNSRTQIFKNESLDTEMLHLTCRVRGQKSGAVSGTLSSHGWGGGIFLHERNHVSSFLLRTCQETTVCLWFSYLVACPGSQAFCEIVFDVQDWWNIPDRKPSMTAFARPELLFHQFHHQGLLISCRCVLNKRDLLQTVCCHSCKQSCWWPSDSSGNGMSVFRLRQWHNPRTWWDTIVNSSVHKCAH